MDVPRAAGCPLAARHFAATVDTLRWLAIKSPASFATRKWLLLAISPSIKSTRWCRTSEVSERQTRCTQSSRRIGHTEFVRVLRLHNPLKVLAQTGFPVVEGKWLAGQL